MSTSTSILRLFYSKIPRSHLYPNPPVFKTLLLSTPNQTPTNRFFSKSISMERVPTTPLASSPSLPSSTHLSLQPIKELPPKLQEIVKLFQAVEEPKAKYEQLLFYGKNLKPLDTQFKTSDNKVQGCVSQVWVRAHFDSEKNVVFEADSDSVLTKGLAALLVQGLSGRPVEEILRVSPDFVTLLGLQQSLTPSRNNGFLNMLKLMQKKAVQLFVEKEKEDFEVSASVNEENPVQYSNLESKNGDLEVGLSFEAAIDDLVSNSDDGVGLGSRGKRIKERLQSELKPTELLVEDISYQHAGHEGVRDSDGGETHFNVKVVSKEFEGKSLVKRHRMVYGLLQEELQSGLHALSIVAKTPSEVEK